MPSHSSKPSSKHSSEAKPCLRRPRAVAGRVLCRWSQTWQRALLALGRNQSYRKPRNPMLHVPKLTRPSEGSSAGLSDLPSLLPPPPIARRRRVLQLAFGRCSKCTMASRARTGEELVPARPRAWCSWCCRRLVGWLTWSAHECSQRELSFAVAGCALRHLWGIPTRATHTEARAPPPMRGRDVIRLARPETPFKSHVLATRAGWC